MSFETSTEAAPRSVRDGDPGLPPHRARVRDGDPGFEPWQLFTLAGLMGATVVVFMSTGQSPAGIILLSLTIFTAAIVGVASWRMLAPFTGDDRLIRPTVPGGRIRAALERDKALVLRAIKELEFDRAMGKISEKDFTEMDTRLRARAARLIRQLDSDTSYRAAIEREVARRLGTNVVTAAAHSQERPAAVVPATEGSAACRACGTGNDVDARFCKQCGAGLETGR